MQKPCCPDDHPEIASDAPEIVLIATTSQEVSDIVSRLSTQQSGSVVLVWCPVPFHPADLMKKHKTLKIKPIKTLKDRDRAVVVVSKTVTGSVLQSLLSNVSDLQVISIT